MDNLASTDKVNKYGYRIENFDEYKPKRWYIPLDNEEEEKKLAQSLEIIENKLKEYEYSDDIPRAYTKNARKMRGWDLIEYNMIYGIPAAFALGSIFNHAHFGAYATPYKLLMARIKFYLGMQVFGGLYVTTKPEWQPQNMGIYMVQYGESRLQKQLDLKFDLYKNVDKIKYKDKKVSYWDYYKHKLERKKIINKYHNETIEDLGLSSPKITSTAQCMRKKCKECSLFM